MDWAASYLNEALGGMDVGARMLVAKLTEPALDTGERAFLATLAPAFTELEDTAENTLFVEGAARLLSEHRFQELPQLADLMDVLEQRVALLVGAARVARRAERVPAHRAGEPGARAALAEHGGRQLRAGAPQPRRGVRARPGASMDYPRAIIAVRQAASELSRFVAEVYDE